MPRFVILEHDHPVRHWDLMLQVGDVLRTWRLASAPEMDVPILAEPSFDHRLMYLEYEGRVSGNRGCVVRWDQGTWEGDLPDAVGESVSLQIEGERISGIAALSYESEDRWIVTFRRLVN